MKTDQRAKARAMMNSSGYGAKMAPRPKLVRPTAPGPATMPMGAPQMSAPEMPVTPGMKNGGKAASGKPRHFAVGGAAKVRQGNASPAGAPLPAKVKSRGSLSGGG